MNIEAAANRLVRTLLAEDHTPLGPKWRVFFFVNGQQSSTVVQAETAELAKQEVTKQGHEVTGVSPMAHVSRSMAEDGPPELPVKFTRIENGQAIHINGVQVGTNTSRRDWVKSKPTSRLRDKVANVWSVDFDIKALQTVFPAIQQQDLVRCFRSSSRDIRRLAAGDIQHMIQSLPSSTDLPA